MSEHRGVPEGDSDAGQAILSLVRVPTSPSAPLAASRVSGFQRHQLTDLVGRTRELTRLDVLLGRDNVRLLTITGAGGVGKTCLARECCVRFGDRFPDGTVVVSLAATQDAELVAIAIAEQIDQPQHPGVTVADYLDACFRDRQMLLVLDNLEHLLQVGPLLVDLLMRHPALTILCTSRVRLDVTGEHVYPLQPLSSEEAHELFIRRATARNLALVLEQGDDDVITAICERLEGMPLAIELAAARLGTLSPAALLDHLQSPLAFLKGGPRDAPQRLQSMRDTIAWSYELLDARHRVVFQRLAVFVGGFTLEAAQHVIGDDDVALDVVEFLVANSLVVPVVSPSSLPRFTMLETIREFGRERLAQDGLERETRLRHADFLIGIAERAIDHDDPQVVFHHAAVYADLENIRAALAWLLDVPEPERALRLAGGISRWWWYEYGAGAGIRTWRERATEGWHWLERALVYRDEVGVEYAATALTGICMITNPLADWDAMKFWSEITIAFGHHHDHPHSLFWGYLTLGMGIWNADRKRDLAIDAFAAAEAVASRLPHPSNRMTNILTEWGNVLFAAGDLDAATQQMTESLRFARIENDPMLRAYAAFNLGRIHVDGDRPGLAIACFLESLEGLRLIQDVARTQGSCLRLSHIALRYRQPRLAVLLLACATHVPLFYGSEVIPDERISELKSALPTAEFAEAWEAGLRLSPEEVIACARTLAALVERGMIAPRRPRGDWHGLTAREREVLALLAEGLSNRAIAARLSISERTTEHHVLHITAKLDVDSRMAAVEAGSRLGLLEPTS